MKPFFRLRFWILIPLLISFSSGLKGQAGGSFYADFKLSGKGAAGRANSMVQDSEGNMLMATASGVVVFDGSNTNLVGTGAEANVLEHVESTQKTYVGCIGRIGFIQRDNKGKFVFTRINVPNVEYEEFDAIATFEKDVYFQSSNWIVKVNDNKVIATWKRPDQGNFDGIFLLQNVVFVNVSSSGLYTLLSGGKFKKSPVDDSKIAEESILFTIQRSKNEVILGSTYPQLFLFNGSELKEFACDKASYLAANWVVNGCRIDKNYMAIGTNRGGFMVVDMYNGSVPEIYNMGSGFPDNNINSMTVDQAHGIWVNYGEGYYNGYSRVDRNIPVKYYSSYPGLSTLVYSIAESPNGALFIGCADGLYRLKQVENAGEYEQAIKKAEAIKQAQKENKSSTSSAGPILTPSGEMPTPLPNPHTPITPEEAATPEESGAIDRAGSKIRKIWKRVKDKIPGSSDGGGTNGGEAQPKGGVLNPRIQGVRMLMPYTNSNIFRFASTTSGEEPQYIYSKIAAISSKVTKILVVPNGLMCATSTGLFLYSEAGTKKLHDGEIKDVVYSAGKIIFVTKVGPFIINLDGSITPINLSPKFKKFTTVFLENPTTLWLGGTNHSLRVTLGPNGRVSKETLIDIPADFPASIDICKAGNTIFFVSGGGLFEYNSADNTAVAAPSTMVNISDQDILQYAINPSSNTLFIKTLEGWKEAKGHNTMEDVGLLDVLNDVRYVFKTTKGNIYALSNRNDIYFLNRNSPAGGTFAGFGVFFKGVLGLDKKPHDLSNLSISYKEAAVEIRWGSNLYLKSDGTWYRWRLDGSAKQPWSSWSKETSYKIQLKPGNYNFIVQARDALGNKTPEEKISFSINPPYYQTWWFYTIIALLLGGIIYLVFRWRNRALIENQKRLEGMVKERTRELGEEKEKTEELLLNILPKAVAQELKDQGKSSVRKHSDSAVMFTDFCNFTLLSKDMSAEQLVEKLDGYFRKFDEIVDKYKLEKIKTIGDAYMCAAGVPQPMANCSLAIVAAALEIIDVVEKADSHWKIRVGIHRGGLVSGVVGKKKFAYDIWGDTVNIASRMESSGEPMQINITEQMYEEIKDYFECTKRGEIEAKSLGKTNMYFVTGFKVNFRLNDNPILPNKEFLSLLTKNH